MNPAPAFWFGRQRMAAVVRELADTRRLSSKQLDRLFKLLSDEFYLLTCEVEGAARHAVEWTISGSTRNVYRVTLYTDGALFCTCPDHRSHCQRWHIVCKHICFVLCRIARVTDPEVFIQRRLEPEAIAAVQTRMTRWRDMSDVIDRDLAARFESLQTADATAPPTPSARPLADDAECAICFDALVQDPPVGLEHCASCRNTLHAACIRKWLETQTRCVYCRGPWAPPRPAKVGEFLNLA